MKLVLFVLFCVNLLALTPAQKAKEKALLSNVNTVLIFTSEAGLSSGRYRFTNIDIEMTTYVLPYEHHFDPFSEKMNLFFKGNTGYSVTEFGKNSLTDKSIQDLGITVNTKVRTYSMGAGGGLRYRTDLGIDLLIGAELIFSRIGSDIETKDPFNDVVDGFFDNEYSDNITYKMRFAAEYKRPYKEYKPYARIGYKTYETAADLDTSNIDDLNVQSSVATITLGTETPSLLKYEDNYLSLEPFIRGNHLYGDAARIVEFDSFMNIGTLAYWNTPHSPQWIKRFFLEVSAARAEGLEGYTFGMGFNINY